jgi:pheromone shutdown protein TraB
VRGVDIGGRSSDWTRPISTAAALLAASARVASIVAVLIASVAAVPMASVVPPVAPLGAFAAFCGLGSQELKKHLRDTYKTYLNKLFNRL